MDVEIGMTVVTQPMTAVVNLQLPIADDCLEISTRSTVVSTQKSDLDILAVPQLTKSELMSKLDVLLSLIEASMPPKRRAAEEPAVLGKRRLPYEQFARPGQPRPLISMTKKEGRYHRIVAAVELGDTRTCVIAKKCSCSPKLVKAVMYQHQLLGTIPIDHFGVSNRLLPAKVQQALTDMNNPFCNSTDLRNHLAASGFLTSRTKIQQTMKKLGYYWGDLDTSLSHKKRMAKLREFSREKEQAGSFLNLLVQVLDDERVVTIFLDQWKAPLAQVPRQLWKKKRSLWRPLERTGVEQKTLTCNVTATLKGFTHIAVTEREITQADSVYFIDAALNDLLDGDRNRDFVIVCDNASWQKGSTLEKAWFSSNMLYTPPRSPLLNYIEYGFASPRHRWRSRSTAGSKKEAIRQIIDIFKESNEKHRLQGVSKHYIKTLKDIVKMNSTIAAPQEDQTN